jgi:two-component sensor histidine kinase
VTNSVRHGPQGANATVEIAIGVERTLLRVEVADRSETSARPKTPSDEGGYGLALVTAMATRWGADPRNGRNVTWFEIELPLPGTSDG